MEELRPVKRETSLFAASGLYLLAAFGLCMMRLCAGTLQLGLMRIWPGITPEWVSLILNVFYYGLFVICPVMYWSGKSDGRMAALRLNPVSAGMTFLTVALALTAVFWINDITVLWSAVWQKFGLNVFAGSYPTPTDTAELTRSIISAGLVACVCEELLFRGVLFPAWEELGTRRAVTVVSVLFAMLHGSWTGFPGQFLCGVLLTVLVLWTDSLYTGMIFHSVYNAGLLIFSYISGRNPESAAAQAQMEADIVGWLGGAAGVLGLLIECAVLGVAVLMLLRIAAVRSRAQLVPKSEVRIGNGELIVILAGVVTTLLFYGLDFMAMLGG